MIRYIFDLDGTLCYKHEKGVAFALPIPERIKKVNELYDKGHVIIIETARGSLTGINWLEATKKQLKEWGLKYHVLRTGVKFYGEYYIDDNALNSEDFFRATEIFNSPDGQDN